MTGQAAEFAIETEGLVKVFGETRAVDGVDLTVRRGEVFGLLGPNGAGKTTVVRMLATLIRPDAGWAKVFGHDVVAGAGKVRECMSLTGQFASVDEDLTGTENLIVLARLLGFKRAAARARAAALLAAFGLTEPAGKQVKKYSGGMRRRLDIAASIIVTPDLLFLDEQTTGLDPRSRNQVWEIVRVLVADGTTVLLTTQYLDEADQLADRIAVIDHGKVIASGTSGELKASVGTGKLRVRLHEAAERERAAALLTDLLGMPAETGSDTRAVGVRVSGPDQAASALAALAAGGVRVSEFSFGQPSLDEVFLAMTGRPRENAQPADAQPADEEPAPAQPTKREVA